MRTLITMTKMTTLKIRMAKMGPRKAPKNTAGSEIKQLQGGREQSHQLCNVSATEYECHILTVLCIQ